MTGYLVNRIAAVLDDALPRSLKRVVKRYCPYMVEGFYQKLAAHSSLEPVEVVIRSGPLAGRRFRCCLKYDRPLWIGNWEPELQKWFQEYIRPGMLVYDVGAHKGFFSLLAAQLVGSTGEVIAFEPHPGNRAEAIANIQRNPDLAKVIVVNECAVSDSNGTEEFSETESCYVAGLSRILPNSKNTKYTVKTITLDEIVASRNRRPDCIKLDIEGAEELAFKGMTRVLEQHRPILMVELHNHECWKGFVELLTRFNYVAKGTSDDRFSTEPKWTDRDQYLAVPSNR